MSESVRKEPKKDSRKAESQHHHADLGPGNDFFAHVDRGKCIKFDGDHLLFCFCHLVPESIWLGMDLRSPHAWLMILGQKTMQVSDLTLMRCSPAGRHFLD